MSNKFLLKKSSVAAKVPLTTDLDYGELALNYADGKLYFKNSSNAVNSFGSSSATETLSNKTLSSPTITGSPLFTSIGGDEGGELRLGTAATNSTLAGGSVTVDIWQNNLRIFESGGTNRGAYLNLSTVSAGVGSGLVTTDGTQTLTNKTLNGVTLTGALTAGGNTGANGYILTSTGTGVQWVSNTAGTLDGLTDVTITAPTAQQVLKYNGSIWQNSDPDSSVASAVFATNAQSDLGLVTDLIVGITEDLGLVTEIAAYIYNMGSLVVDGIVSLNNIDQSIKADYIAYSIIFGF